MSVNGGGGRRASRRPSTVAREDAWAKEIEKKFRRIAGADGKISFEEFKAAIEVKEVGIRSYSLSFLLFWLSVYI